MIVRELQEGLAFAAVPDVLWGWCVGWERGQEVEREVALVLIEVIFLDESHAEVVHVERYGDFRVFDSQHRLLEAGVQLGKFWWDFFWYFQFQFKGIFLEAGHYYSAFSFRGYNLMVRGLLRGLGEKIINKKFSPFWSKIIEKPLLGLSLIWRLGIKAERKAFDWGFRERKTLENVPVVSIGNVTVGGSGKTPMVQTLVQGLVTTGVTPLVLSRGYRGGDEAAMMRETFSTFERPVFLGVGKNRARVAQEILRNHSENSKPKIDVVLLDDGLQHWALQRQAEVVMLNLVPEAAFLDTQKMRVLPAGRLREPTAEALQRAHVVVLHNAGLVKGRDQLEALQNLRLKLETGFPKLVLVESEMKVSPDVDLQNKSVYAFCGIASPEAFARALLQRTTCQEYRLVDWKADLSCSGKTRVLHVRYFPDHHHFQDQDIHQIHRDLKRLQLDQAWTTEKDLKRSPKISFAKPIQVRLVFKHGATEFNQVLRSCTNLDFGLRDDLE